ncbi:hypothetical protein JTE90_009095 [Oedothorax gibbosus]|uniref:OAR domain-containing protein n=1 Tax=Oedothorax gibbosus TaxID=931172 RepID=A0AAV6V244_9ARAC|nr:hypothetical protein JTE90_009095 [Oedothorax gibbosus]
MQRKSQEAAERLNESDHSSDGHTSDQHTSSNQHQRTMDQQASASSTQHHQPSFINQPQDQSSLVYSQHHHQVSSESSSSRGSSPVRGTTSSNHHSQQLQPTIGKEDERPYHSQQQRPSTTIKEDFRSSSIASLRAKAFEHASRVFGEDRKLTETHISDAGAVATAVKDTPVVNERPSIHCISSLF